MCMKIVSPYVYCIHAPSLMWLYFWCYNNSLKWQCWVCINNIIDAIASTLSFLVSLLNLRGAHAFILCSYASSEVTACSPFHPKRFKATFRLYYWSIMTLSTCLILCSSVLPCDVVLCIFFYIYLLGYLFSIWVYTYYYSYIVSTTTIFSLSI